MFLRDDVSRIASNLDSVNSNEIISILEKIRESFQSEITKEYLSGKITAINDAKNEDDKKQLCLRLKPYFDWYMQGQ